MKTANLAQVSAPALHEVVKAKELEIHYQPDSDVVIHKAGCQHRQSDRSTWGAYDVRPFDLSIERSEDDWYYVAPCAKKAS